MSDATDNAEKQAAAQLSSIKEMVAALNCDYSRLEELRDSKKQKEDLSEEIIELIVERAALQAANDPEDAERITELNDELDTLASDYETCFSTEEEEELKELEEEAGDCESQEQAERRIQEDALSVEVRSGWCSSPSEMEAEEFKILLCTGGPACRLIGELNQYNEPDKVRLQYQDWFTPWCDFYLDSEDEEIVLEYCRQFYFGE